jgi:transcriptional regulator with XRE-family HTH domain
MKTNGRTRWTAKDGWNLRNYRLIMGWSQTELAEQLGCNQATVSRIEHGYAPSKTIRILIKHIAKETA